MLQRNSDISMLNHIYRNTRMGLYSICAILPKTQNKQLHSDLREQGKQYCRYSQRASALLNQYGEKPKKTGPVSKFSLRLGLRMHTALNTSSGHLAELVINGSNMGVIDMTRRLKEYSLCNQNITQLGEDVLQFETQAIDQMKPYL